MIARIYKDCLPTTQQGTEFHMQGVYMNLLTCLRCISMSICIQLRIHRLHRNTVTLEWERERDKETNAHHGYIPNSTVVTRKCKNTCFVVVCVGCHLIWAQKRKEQTTRQSTTTKRAQWQQAKHKKPSIGTTTKRKSIRNRGGKYEK